MLEVETSKVVEPSFNDEIKIRDAVKSLIAGDIFVKLSERFANNIEGTSIPEILTINMPGDNGEKTAEKMITLFDSYELAKEYCDQEAVRANYPFDYNIYYIGKMDKVEGLETLKGFPKLAPNKRFASINNINTILNNAIALGVKCVGVNTKDFKFVADIFYFMHIAEIPRTDAEVVMTNDEYEAYQNDRESFNYRFNQMKIYNFEKPFDITDAKEKDLENILFDTDLDDEKSVSFESKAKELKYEELCSLYLHIYAEYVKMAKDMENEELETMYIEKAKTIENVLAEKVFNDLWVSPENNNKSGYHFYTLMKPLGVPEGQPQSFVTLTDTANDLVLIYSNIYMTNSQYIYRKIENINEVIDLVNAENLHGVKISAGPTPVATVSIDKLKEMNEKYNKVEE